MGRLCGFYPLEKELMFSPVKTIIALSFKKSNSFFDFFEINLYNLFFFCYSFVEVIFMSVFGDNLRKARKQLGLTQRQLAARIGARHNSVSNWETGQNEPDTLTIRRLCDALSITANDLFIEDPSSPAPVSRDELKFALFEESGQNMEDMLQEVLDFAQFVKEKHQRQKDPQSPPPRYPILGKKEGQ